MKILITGGAGFIGSNLAFRVKSAYPRSKITCLDNLTRKGSALNVKRLEKAGIIFMRGDVGIQKNIDACGSFDLVIDCAADPSVLSGIRTSVDDLIRTNFTGTLNTLKAACDFKADVIFLSTSRVYPIDLLNSINTIESKARFVISGKQSMVGISKKGISESFPLTGKSRSFYGSSKLASELFLGEFGNFGNMGNYVINRCGVIAGPWQMGKVDQGVMTLWAARHYFGQPLSYIGWGGKGKQVRDFLHIDDLCDLVLKQISNMQLFNAKVLHVGGGAENSASLFELTAIVREAAGRSVPMQEVTSNREADVKLYISDNSFIEKLTSWRPVRSLRQIANDTINWIRRNEKILQPIIGS